MKRLAIEVWSDIACPWCYVGKRRLESALRALPFRDSVDVVWRAFELDPRAPASEEATGVPYAERLAKKYGTSTPDAEKAIQRLVDVAAAEGIELRFDRIRPGNTFDAHRLVRFAAERGKQGAMKERLLAAYLTEGEAISDRAVLERLAASIELDPYEANAVLTEGAYAEQVRADEEDARALGISGVPLFAIARRYGVAGAQPAELLARAISRAWGEFEEGPNPPSARGAACGPEGCD